MIYLEIKLKNFMEIFYPFDKNWNQREKARIKKENLKDPINNFN